MKAALGLDVGTTSVKAVVVGENGEVVGEGASSVLQMRSPNRGWAVQSTNALHSAVVECLTTTAELFSDGVEVLSLTMAAQSGSLVTADSAGILADDLTTWMDTRTRPIVDKWQRDGTASIIRAESGWTVHPGQGLPQLAWLRAHDSELWASIGHIASADDLVTHWLTDTWSTNPSNAAGMALIDIRTGKWSQQLCGLVGLDIKHLSRIRQSGEVIGPLTPEIAQRTGLSSQLAVVSGGHDQACTALALGVTEPRHALLAGGTAWVLTTVVPTAGVDNVPDEMNVSFHVAPHVNTASIYLGGMGANIEWWLASNKPKQIGNDRYTDLESGLATVTISASSPYFRPIEDAADRHPGAGGFVDEDSETSDPQRAFSIMEYAAFKLKSALFRIPPDRRPSDLDVVGGMTQSSVWPQLIADICGITVIRSRETSLPALGAAVIGGVTTDIFASVEAAIGSLDLKSEEIQPNLQNADIYQHRYQSHLDQESHL